MLKIFLLFLSSTFLFASSTTTATTQIPDLTFTWVGIACLFIFMVGYFFIIMEDEYKIDKSKPALFIGTLCFILVALYYAFNGLNMDFVKTQVEHQILEIAVIFFFLFVAMTFIEVLTHLKVFDVLKYNLISKGYTYRKLFWLTGIIAFFLSPVADNLTTALVLSTVLITIDKTKTEFLVPGAINIIVAANAGGAWSPFGDITTLMAWSAGKGQFADFIFLFPASIIGYVVTAFILSKYVPNEVPNFDITKEEKPQMQDGAKTVIILGISTIVIAVLSHQVLHLPSMWGMLFGLSILSIYSYGLKKDKTKDHFNIFNSIAKVENNTLLFFFGILSAVGVLYFIGWLTLAAVVYDPSVLGPTFSNIMVGFLSAIVDNIPVMSAVLKANPSMDLSQWMLVTLTAGIGGSMISFGSAAGVGVMGKMRGIYTFASHMKYSWAIVVGYFFSIAIWFLQYEILKIGI